MPGGIAAFVLALSLPGCAAVPDPFYPPFCDHHLAAHYIVPEAGRIRIPATSRELVVQKLQVEPDPNGESFDKDGTRWLLYDRGTRVRLRGSFRAYSSPTGTGATPAELLPGARDIRVLEAPR